MKFHALLPVCLISLALGLIPSPSGSTAGFGTRFDFPTGITPAAMRAGDIDRDGVPDLIIAGRRVAGPGMHVFLARPGGGFISGAQIALPADARHLEVADLDLDGRLDVVVLTAASTGDGSESSQFVVCRGLPNNEFEIVPQVENFPRFGSPRGLVIGTFSGDPIPDLVLGESLTNIGLSSHVHCLLGRGDGQFAPWSVYETIAETIPGRMVAGDVNTDGRLDFVVAQRISANSLWLGHGDGTFGAFDWIGGAGPSDIALGDFDSNNLPDAVLSQYASPSLQVRFGPLTGFPCCFDCCTGLEVLTGSGASAVESADLDGDGHLDLVIAMWLENRIGVLMGRGDGTFKGPYTLPVGLRPVDVALGDFDDDGNPDVASVSQADETVTIHFQSEAAIVGVPPMPSELGLSLPHPTPARGIVWADVTLTPGPAATLEIVDVRGRVVSSQQLAGDGPRRVALFETDRTSAGVYWARLTQGGNRIVRRILFLP